jgi:phosphoglycolate phosphatase
VKRLLLVLDFDGLLVNSYELLRLSFEEYGLDVGDEGRFRNRRKFLKYLGGGKEWLGNLASIALPRRKALRRSLTRNYCEYGRILPEFVPLLNECIASPAIHAGIVSRNYTRNPGATIRQVLANSAVEERDLDFVIPVPVGAKKLDVLEGMRSARYALNVFAGDEVGDYLAALECGYTVVMASYGFDTRQRLERRGQVPPELIHDTPQTLAATLRDLVLPYLWS